MYSETKNYIKQVLAHPKVSIWRLFRALNRDDFVESHRLLRNLALGLPDRVAKDYNEELEYLSTHPFAGVDVFPYGEVSPEPTVDAGWDAKAGLPFVVHNGKRFYGLKRHTADQAAKSYLYFVSTEGILGSGIRAKSPHAYVDADFKVEKGDILVDIGCSDGLFAFANVDEAGYVYLFETEKIWIKPLRCSFKPYEGKVSIINKFVSCKTGGSEIRLDDALSGTNGDGAYFLKMDIEGGERDVIAASEEFFRSHRVKLSCCVYHRQDDSAVIKGMLEGMGFRTRFSDGYMLPAMNGIEFPYFRKGVIYARNY